jgi:hypothetical protein
MGGWFLTPFFTDRMLLRPDNGRVDHQPFQANVVVERFGHAAPDSLLRSTTGMFEHKIPTTKAGRQSRQGAPVFAIR